MHRQNLGEMLLAANLIDEVQMQIALADTLTGRHRAPRNVPADPVFWDIVAEMASGDLDERLTRIETKLEQVWVLLEKILRTMEAREGVHRG